MFFILSKTVAFLVLPSNLLVIFGVAGLALMATRWKRAGIYLVVASFILLAIAGFSPLGNLLTHALESRFPPWDSARGAPDGVVVLGGEISPRLSSSYGEPVIGNGGTRLVAMAKLARAYPNARLVYSGGDASLFANQSAEADFVPLLLGSLGIPTSRMTLESQSRNTAENAIFTKNLVKPKPGERWLLVTSAQHMPRAMGCFRKVEFPVEAYPVGWQTDKGPDLMPGRTLVHGLARLDSATYEWIGLLAYWATGKTAEFLPAP